MFNRLDHDALKKISQYTGSPSLMLSSRKFAFANDKRFSFYLWTHEGREWPDLSTFYKHMTPPMNRQKPSDYAVTTKNFHAALVLRLLELNPERLTIHFEGPTSDLLFQLLTEARQSPHCIDIIQAAKEELRQTLLFSFKHPEYVEQVKTKQIILIVTIFGSSSNPAFSNFLEKLHNHNSASHLAYVGNFKLECDDAKNSENIAGNLEQPVRDILANKVKDYVNYNMTRPDLSQEIEAAENLYKILNGKRPLLKINFYPFIESIESTINNPECKESRKPSACFIALLNELKEVFKEMTKAKLKPLQKQKVIAADPKPLRAKR